MMDKLDNRLVSVTLLMAVNCKINLKHREVDLLAEQWVKGRLTSARIDLLVSTQLINSQPKQLKNKSLLPRPRLLPP